MAETLMQIQPDSSSSLQQLKTVRIWHMVALTVVLLIAAFLNFYQLGQAGYPNFYYAAAVKSMLESWHNFFYVSFDPVGFISVDKPPVDLWIQAASAKLFGFSPFSLLLPQALAGVLSVALLYHLVHRAFGSVAGLLAALALAITPINVVTNRSNTMDSMLVLVVLLGAWSISLAAETGRFRWLLLCAVEVGLGFNIKMAQAYLVIPAFALVYLLGAPLSRRKRLAHLVLALLILLAVSFSWITAVDLTPTAQRPYVGSSLNNSELTLAIGANGLGRIVSPYALLPLAPLLGIHVPASLAHSVNNAAAQASANPEIGSPGPFRLLSGQLAKQVGWFLPLALLGLLASAWLIWSGRFHLPRTRSQKALVLWGIWLFTGGIFFSAASAFHAYYLVMLSPALSALAGIGVVALWRCYRRPGWLGWLLPLTLVSTAGIQAVFLSDVPVWRNWLTPLVIGLCLVGGVLLVILRSGVMMDQQAPVAAHVPKSRHIPGRLAQPIFPEIALAVALLALSMMPLAWGGVSVIENSSFMFPDAGPRPWLVSYFGPEKIGSLARPPYVVGPQLIHYLEANQGQTTYLVATAYSDTAAPFLLKTDKIAISLGGFLGGDRVLTPQQLAQLVDNGTIRFFLLPEQAKNIVDLTDWVQSHCATVPPDLWQSAPVNAPDAVNNTFAGPQQLFDCANHR